MPDPKTLKVNDHIRFVTLPVEWDDPSYSVHKSCVRFMKQLIKRQFSFRICEIDEYGIHWIEARIRRGKIIEYHGWGIYEKTNWTKVKKRV